MAGLRPIICEGYCSFYKPGAKEEMACGGLTRAEAVLSRMADQPAPKSDKPMSAGAVAALEESVCQTCPFRVDGCDYADRVVGAVPCGGFIYLALLIDDGVISDDDIRRAL